MIKAEIVTRNCYFGGMSRMNELPVSAKIRYEKKIDVNLKSNEK